MNDAFIAGPDFDGADVAALVQGHGEDEIAKDVGAVGGQGVGAVEGEDEIGRAELPAFGEGGGGREIAGVALGGSGLGPGLEDLELSGREAAAAEEVAFAGFGRPGGHIAGGGDLGDLGGVTGGVLIGQEREGRGLAGAMAGRAGVEQDGGDVTREGGRRGVGGNGEYQEGPEGAQGHLNLVYGPRGDAVFDVFQA